MTARGRAAPMGTARAPGWAPSVTLDEGLGRTVDWVRGRVGAPTG